MTKALGNTARIEVIEPVGLEVQMGIGHWNRVGADQ
jgi:hypothetical protein